MLYVGTRHLCKSLEGIKKMQTKIKIIKKARECIGKDELSKAFELLNQVVENESDSNTLIIQKARNNNIEQKIHRGIISNEDSLLEKNKIRNTLLELCSSLEGKSDIINNLPLDEEDKSSKRSFATISIISLFVSISLLLLLVFAKPLQFQGILQDRVFYILLISMGISSALFLYGILKSNPLLSGSSHSKKIQVGGPSFFAIMVILGGFWLIPKDSYFDLTIRAIEKKNGNIIYSDRKAEVKVFLPTGIREAYFAKNGEAVIKAIPSELLNSEQKILTEIYYYKQSSKNSSYKLTSNVLEIEHIFNEGGTTRGILNKRTANIMLLELLLPFRLMLFKEGNDKSETNFNQYCNSSNQEHIKKIDLNAPVDFSASKLNDAFDVLIVENPISLNLIKGKNYGQLIMDACFKFKQKTNLLSQIDSEGIDPEIQRDIIMIARSNFVNIATGTENIDSDVLEILLNDLCVMLNRIGKRNNLNPFAVFYEM